MIFVGKGVFADVTELKKLENHNSVFCEWVPSPMTNVSIRAHKGDAQGEEKAM